ncbi:MAG: ABC transporter permease [Armatimonadota bacterium]|nr:ABC transporter permease [Armatimonadota bacterium]MDR7534478.1 ABC transporter permease [Armatimonadota bacterium]MDR7535787.1 ABC transporter permease [Armatimonadota bacterium]
MRPSTLGFATSAAGRSGPTARPRVWSPFRRDVPTLAAAAALLLIVAMAVTAPVITPYTYDRQNLEGALQGPSPTHWLGTDNYGRDVFSRVAYGARISLAVGAVAVTAEATIGALWGMVAGLYGGRLDAWMMRVVDLLIAFPALLLAILITGIFGRSMVNVVLALVLTAWPGIARLVRSHAVVLREREFVEAARAAGATPGRVVRRHLLPNVVHLVIARATLDASVIILLEATLSFVGLGVQPPQPSWGLMINEAFGYLRSTPYLLVAPAVFLSLTVISLNILGEALTVALDPRRRRSRLTGARTERA